MLPVSSWPPGPPGASLSPFGRPREINVSCHCHGYIIPKGAWIVNTGGGNRVVMFVPSWRKDLYYQPSRQMGSGLLPGSLPPGPIRPTHDQCLEAWRAWQRKTGITGEVMPKPGRVAPNWDGWRYVPAPSRTLVQPCSGGLVVADGQNVVITGSGSAHIIEAFSV